MVDVPHGLPVKVVIRAFAAAVLLALPASAQEAARLVRDPHVPGAVTAVWTPMGTDIAVAGERFEGGGPVRRDDPWHVGSLTKAMTATLAARLVAIGEISWDDKAGAILNAPDPWGDVTLAEFLTHRSGMAANLSPWRTLLRPGRGNYVAAMFATRPAGPRGAFLYSNAGYVVAGAMLEAVTGEAWEELMRREVFAPLGMDGAGFGAPDPGPRGHLEGHAVPPGPLADNIPAMGPAGTVHATAGDMLRFLRSHATRDRGFLPAEEWDRLHAPVGDHAMGWRAQGGTLRHLGSNTMWFAGMRIDRGSAVFVAVNAGGEAARDAVITALDAMP
jgi:CubicO group peptidase (beta-lactamase class C family)